MEGVVASTCHLFREGSLMTMTIFKLVHPKLSFSTLLDTFMLSWAVRVEYGFLCQ